MLTPGPPLASVHSEQPSTSCSQLAKASSPWAWSTVGLSFLAYALAILSGPHGSQGDPVTLWGFQCQSPGWST